MSKQPKLRITGPQRFAEEICDVDEAKEILFRSDGVILYTVVEGKLIQSYGELVKLCAQDEYKNKEFLTVKEIPFVGSGG